jgi:RNA polymerase sigma factor (sigma-70 family)
LRYLRQAACKAPAGEVPDEELLRRFACRGDEAAFELLVWRHGPMVWGLCRRLLRHEEDAEDAFQAVFLTLARKARSIVRQSAVASWLYKVAYRAALAARRRALVYSHGAALTEIEAPATEDDLVQADLRSALDREVNALPERYRRVIVLCYFEGKTYSEAARLLGCPKGTVAARLSRARERLGRRLKPRGWALTTGALGTILAEQATAAVPMHLARLTVSAALAFTSKVASVGVVSAKVVALTEGVLRMLWLSKAKMMVSGVLAVLLAGTGVGLVVRHSWAGNGPERGPAAQIQSPVSQISHAGPVVASNAKDAKPEDERKATDSS